MANAKKKDDEKQVEERKVIGKASATENKPNTSEGFSFWLAPEEIVNPFDIVEADHMEGTRTFGLVTNISQITDVRSHLSNYISSDFGSIETIPQTPRQGANVADVDVMANFDSSEEKRYPMGIYMPVQSDSSIRFADEEGIHIALGIDKMAEYEEEYKEKVRIPAGVIEMSNGTRARVYLDKRYVLGPEAAHVNVAGISGLATKTSYAMFLIQSILQTVGSDDIAVIILNVKQNDLLVIDKPRKDLKPDEHELWEYFGLEPKQFDQVRYLLPWGKQSPSYPNCFGDPPDDYYMYSYSLEDVIGEGAQPGPGLDLLIRVPDVYQTMSALVSEASQGIMNNEPKWRDVRTWDDLLNGPPLMKEGQPQPLGKEIRASSVGRFLRILRRVVKNRQSGIFVLQRAPSKAVNLGEEIRNIKGGHTYVVDIAKLYDEERALVFGHIIREIYNMYAEASIEDEGTLPKKVIIFVDELNKYAPSKKGEGESSILEYVLDISARGRSLGVVLISAEQFMSEVHGQVVGNCATKVIGRSDSSELSSTAYRFISKDIKGHLTRLDKGELLLSHPIYRQPIKVKFPKPAYQAIGHTRRG